MLHSGCVKLHQKFRDFVGLPMGLLREESPKNRMNTGLFGSRSGEYGLKAARVNIPIIASGGAGKKEDFLELFHHKGIDAGLAAGIFHQKLLGIRELKEYLNASGVEMRL